MKALTHAAQPNPVLAQMLIDSVEGVSHTSSLAQEARKTPGGPTIERYILSLMRPAPTDATKGSLVQLPVVNLPKSLHVAFAADAVLYLTSRLNVMDGKLLRTAMTWF